MFPVKNFISFATILRGSMLMSLGFPRDIALLTAFLATATAAPKAENLGSVE